MGNLMCFQEDWDNDGVFVVADRFRGYCGVGNWDIVFPVPAFNKGCR